MILTENINIDDSMLFYLSARNTLKESIELTDPKKKKTLENFIMNEASDYEILSLLLTQELPENKYDLTKEAFLLSDLKELVIENYTEMSEMMGEVVTKDFILEVGPLYPDFSTAAPLLEFTRAKVNEAGETRGGIKWYGEIDTPARYKKKVPASPNPGPTPRENWKNRANYSRDNWRNKPGYSKGGTGELSKGGLSKGVKTGLKYAGGAAVAALLGYGAVKLYKAFLSKAARACKGKSGAEKTACIQAYKVKGYQAQANAIKAGMSKCEKSKDPEKCKSIAGKKIVLINAKIAKAQRG